MGYGRFPPDRRHRRHPVLLRQGRLTGTIETVMLLDTPQRLVLDAYRDDLFSF
jgi:hypothetical protein